MKISKPLPLTTSWIITWTIPNLQLAQEEFMQDYLALGYPDLLEIYSKLVFLEIDLIKKDLINKHCT